MRVALAGVGEDTLLLKTGRMTGAEVDAENRRARVGAAAKWRDVSALASPRGLAALSGSSAEVGVVGYTLGGGQGWLARKHGLACNSVLAAEVVTADGQLVRADHEHEPDLFWALRGGGGNFGAVTALEFELYPVAELYAGMFAWPWERTADVLHAWREWVPSLPDELSTWARILQVPPLPDIPEPVRGRQLVVVEAAYLGAQEPGRELLRPLRDLGPELDTFAVVPPAVLGQLHMDPEDPVPFAQGGQLLDELPPAAIDAIVEAAGPGSGSPLLSLELRQLGGALTSRPAERGRARHPGSRVPYPWRRHAHGPGHGARDQRAVGCRRRRARAMGLGRQVRQLHRRADRRAHLLPAGDLRSATRSEATLRPGRPLPRQPPDPVRERPSG